MEQTILVVDDSADNRHVYGLFLEHFGYSVVEAADGCEGVKKAREHLPDLILMDISMPILDGLEATELLKVDPDTKHIPVIAVTAHEGPDMRAKALRCGCDSFLAKPVPPRRVLQEIQRFLDPPN